MMLMLLGQAMMALPILMPLLFAAVFVAVYVSGLFLNLALWFFYLLSPRAQARFIPLQTITIGATLVGSAALAYGIWVYWTQPLIN